MTEKELKKLRRADLLEMMLALSRENEDLRSQLEQANKRLEDRTIAIENAGSLAEAALRLNGIFEAAQAACDQYTQNIRQRSENIEQLCSRMEEETRAKCDRMLSEARLQVELSHEEPAQENLPQSHIVEDLLIPIPEDSTQDGYL